MGKCADLFPFFVRPSRPSSLHLSCSHDGGFVLATTTAGVVLVLDGASRHTLYEVPVHGATAAFYTFGDRFIVAHKTSTLTLWEATSPMPFSLPGVDLRDSLSLYCSGVDGALCEIRLINNIPKREIVLQTPPLECMPPGYRLQTQPCTVIADVPHCLGCQDENVCIFRGVRLLPLGGENAKLLIQDSHSYPLLFRKANAGKGQIQSIKVRLVDIWATILCAMHVVLHRRRTLWPVEGGFGPHYGLRRSDSCKAQPLLYANLR
jgi:hypothetical protein